ncbi:hypothetical protein RirG_212550 [Rhizophagus irregularis DAOM 197198w]|uniref:DUF8211 domain-containing protein n=1 Tax=Rhizophagus irregularis (strain DAOM 197198w) TaxID=1432141 RepID=A0A015JPE1_RHIIW|nr:hypothetical protein RirG_212550 [Rhizophagus irregularis DAOM 197198w]
MSHDRCACINHQQNLAKHHFYKNIKPKNNILKKQTNEDFINNKSSHANLLYHRWLSSQPKHHYSKRTGVSYISSIHARDANSILKLGSKHMYRKVFSNFQRIFSPNLCTQQKQEKRFTRACRHVLGKAIGDDHQAILATARKHKFIFLKNQYIKFPIRHLVYKKSFIEPNPEDYPFLVPFYAKRHLNENKTWKNINTLSKHLNPPTPSKITPKPPDVTEPFNPIPNMFIPKKYRDIIPKDPIYVNNCFITPGSREWFTYMYNLEKSIDEQAEQEFNERVHREVTQAFERSHIENQERRTKEIEERKQ